MGTVIFAIDNPLLSSSLMSRCRRNGAYIEACVGKWKGTYEVSYMMHRKDFEKLKIKEDFCKRQEAILWIKPDFSCLDYDTEEYYGDLVLYSKEPEGNWTYTEALNLFLKVE